MDNANALEIIKGIEGLEEVAAQELDWLVSESEIISLDIGELLFQKGSESNYLYIVLSGEFRIFFRQEKGEREISRMRAGQVTGVLPYSRMTHATGFAEVRERASVLRCHRDKFPEMIREKHSLTTALVHMMTSRVREFTMLREQNEKMMSLGKLSAGLAHELNNPSAAIIRSAQELQTNLTETPESFKKVLTLDMTPEQVDNVVNCMKEQIACECPTLNMMERSALEDDIADWLEDNGVEDGFELAEQFVDRGYDIPLLERMVAPLNESAVGPVMHWVARNLVTEVLVDEIQTASKRISDLVGSIKSYSHMDRGHDKSSFDIHEGLLNTLTMLNHKVKKAGMEMIQEFDESLPKIQARISELNQVWTNLIDNAIDAMEDVNNPRLTIRTLAQKDMVCVDIEDNGAGIPQEVQNQIFDPFFTTKEVGKGTGLGLEITRRIINQHEGTITVTSQPGQTVFRVCLPLT